MNLTIELPDELGAALKAQAKAPGVSPARYISRVLENTLAPEMEQQKGDQPFETGYGMWAKYGPAPSALLCNCSRFLCLTHVGTEGQRR